LLLLPHRGCHFNCQLDVVLGEDNLKHMIEVILIITFIVAIVNAISIGYNLGKNKQDNDLEKLEFFNEQMLERIMDNYKNKK